MIIVDKHIITLILLYFILTMTMFGSCAKIAIKLPSPLKDMPLISELYIHHRNLLVMIMVVR